MVSTDSDVSDDIIVEDEKKEPAKPSIAATFALGRRLVRGQLS